MLSYEDLLHHLFVAGQTGVGKSSFLAGLALRAIGQGISVCVVEPHSQLIEAIVRRLPEEQLRKCVLIDLTEAEFPVGLSLFDPPNPPTPVNMAEAATLAYAVFSSLWELEAASAPRLLHVLRALTYTLLENNATLAESLLLFSSDTVRANMVAKLTSPEAIAFWQDYNARSGREKRELTDSLTNKIGSFLALPMVRNMVGQASTLDFQELMDSGKILLVNLSPRFEEASRLVAGIVLAKLLLAAFARAADPEAKRRPAMLILDEFQRWASPTTAVFIHEARKLNVATVLATQTLASLSEENRAAALACGNLMVFRVSGLDAPILAKNFDHTPTPGEVIGYEPIRAPCANVVEHLVRRGHTNPVVAQFTTDYLMPLEALLRKLTGQERLFSFGCVMMMHPAAVIDGQQLVNDALSQCMRTGRADGFIHPHALFILGGAADPSITYVFWSHLTRSLLSGGEFMGYEKSAHRFGQPGFRTEQGLTTFLASYTRPSLLDRLLHVTPQVPERVVAFVRLLRSLRAVMEVLAREPVLVDTGQYQPKYQQRTYADMEHQIANELSQMPNFHARVRFLSCGEQVLETTPLPPPVSGAEFTERIAGIKRRMWEGGVTRYYKEVEKAIRERQFWLLGQDEADEPPPGRF